MDRIDRLLEILSACDGMISRRFVEAQRVVLKKAVVADAGASDRGDEARALASSTGDPSSATVSPVVAPASDFKTPISVLFMEPGRDDLNRLVREDISEGEPGCFRLGEAVADDAVMVIAGRVGDLIALASSLHWWRFERFSRLYLLAAPSEPDLMRAKALAVCVRGNLKAAFQFMGWPSEKDRDPLALAESLTEGIAGRRVHLFASEQALGWESIVGDANWDAGGPES